MLYRFIERRRDDKHSKIPLGWTDQQIDEVLIRSTEETKTDWKIIIFFFFEK
jgi:hypothetical protein